MRRRKMAAISLGDPRLNPHTSRPPHHHGLVVEEIDGLLRAFKDGHVERFPVVPEVPCTWSTPDALDVVSRDVVVDPSTRVWARLYAPTTTSPRHAKLPVLVYFHGGGFCLGSASWSCYHEFLSRLASRAACLVMSVNYRLAPEHRLPAAFDDGLAAVGWLRQQHEEARWWWGRCDFTRVFLGGDSAGGAIAHNVALRLASLRGTASPRGVVLIQPFFGGEARTASERSSAPPPGTSALSLAASDAYWRLSLPAGASRDHPWCNPLAGGGAGLGEVGLPPYLVCVAEMDILREREVEFCRAMRRAGKSVEQVVHAGVGHAFQVLNPSRTPQSRAQAQAQEMISQIRAFLSR